MIGVPFLRGVLLGALTVLVAVLLPAALVLPLFAVLLGVAAGVYPGLAMAEEGMAAARGQWAAAVAFAALAVLALWRWPLLLAAAWLLHAGWDALHHGRSPGGRARAYPGLCLGYDLVVAGYVAWWVLRG